MFLALLGLLDFNNISQFHNLNVFFKKISHRLAPRIIRRCDGWWWLWWLWLRCARKHDPRSQPRLDHLTAAWWWWWLVVVVARSCHNGQGNPCMILYLRTQKKIIKTWARMDMMHCMVELYCSRTLSLHRAHLFSVLQHPHRCRRYGLLFAFGMELYESSRRSGRRSSQRRRRTRKEERTKNKPNNPNIEGCGKLWQSLGMWAVICIWRAIPGGLMSVETESCEYSTL